MAEAMMMSRFPRPVYRYMLREMEKSSCCPESWDRPSQQELTDPAEAGTFHGSPRTTERNRIYLRC